MNCLVLSHAPLTNQINTNKEIAVLIPHYYNIIHFNESNSYNTNVIHIKTFRVDLYHLILIIVYIGYKIITTYRDKIYLWLHIIFEIFTVFL